MTDEQNTTLPYVPPAPAQALTYAETKWRLDERQAAALGRASEAIPRSFRGKPGDILAVWMMGDELGISRMAMLRGAFVVNGKPQLSGDLLMAIAKANGVRVIERTVTDPDTGEMSATCTATMPGGDETTVEFTQADAVAAGLWGSSDPWRKYPKRMLQMRARGWCLRDAIPDKLAGVYTEGELATPDMRDITPEGVDQ